MARWSSEQIEQAKQMQRLGKSMKAIGEVFGCSKDKVRNELEISYGRGPLAPFVVPKVERMIVPDATWAERHYRAALEHRDLTAQLCGDPLPGYSALERRGA